jgi:ankyrin repeat protein
VELLFKSKVELDEAKIGTLKSVIVAGDVDATAFLLRLGVPVNIGENEQPIHVASRLGREEIVTLLLQCGASLTSRTDTGNTALHLASEEGHLNVVKCLVEKDRNGMCSLNFENETPLHLAARKGRDCLVKYFAENSCNINAASTNGATCLHVACENGHYTTVECLLKYGAQVNAVNSANQTPLHIAACRGQTKIVEQLFQHNANLSLRDKDGMTTLMAASRNGHQDTVRLIMQHGSNTEDIDRNGNTVAQFAVQNESANILKFVSQQQVNLEVHEETQDVLADNIRDLPKNNDKVEGVDNDGWKPLNVSAQEGNEKSVRFFVWVGFVMCGCMYVWVCVCGWVL